ncbi:glycosyltransferase [Sphingomonas nostoxanthinifaciens]|uniref:glycosyltransferase n=1 Tax=Sphingomonas nostoxanthinifaciens TaxID=2872652 RepID=UPI001CC20C3D|nr:glycosyltransferase [Sphingomonas nostoxanthinifaciens]UAK23500.1 glycosyltransferase [Sphingomonas nostoxanthinifaciens]
MTIAAGLSLAIWLYLVLGHARFWRADQTDTAPIVAPAAWPAVLAVVPARDEAPVIGRAVASLLAQDYPGALTVVLVDDGSRDGTADFAREAAAGDPRLQIVAGSAPPAGWTGKLWALENGLRQSSKGAPWLWFSDADIAHAPDTLRMLVARGENEGLALHSSMALLETGGFAERALIPAFVFFFQMLYPFARVNDPADRMAAAAGGCMLIRRSALKGAGGLATIASAIIDDCAMGVAMKGQGPVRLALTHRSRSIRPYGGWGAIGAMIARSAYAQLRYSRALLVGTLLGLALVYLVPPAAALFGHGLARAFGLGAWGLMTVAFQPMLHFYRRSPLWGVALPAIALFYSGATFASAWAHWRGRGGMWKGRAQAQLGA